MGLIDKDSDYTFELQDNGKIKISKKAIQIDIDKSLINAHAGDPVIIKEIRNFDKLSGVYTTSLDDHVAVSRMQGEYVYIDALNRGNTVIFVQAYNAEDVKISMIVKTALLDIQLSTYNVTIRTSNVEEQVTILTWNTMQNITLTKPNPALTGITAEVSGTHIVIKSSDTYQTGKTSVEINCDNSTGPKTLEIEVL